LNCDLGVTVLTAPTSTGRGGGEAAADGMAA